MKFPKIRQQSNMAVSVSGLSGGINVYDTLSAVDNSQLTAADNMWWRGSALKTRPGLRKTGKGYDAAYTHQQWVSDHETLLTRCVSLEDGRCEFSAARMTQNNGFEKIGKEGKSFYAKTVSGTPPTAFGCHAIKNKTEQSEYLFFLSSGEIIRENTGALSPLDGEGWVSVDPYVPTLNIDERNYQAPNMLTGQFKSRFVPDGETAFFQLPLKELTYNEGEDFMVRFSLIDYGSGEQDSYEMCIKASDVFKEPSGRTTGIAKVDVKTTNLKLSSYENVYNPQACVYFWPESGKVNLYLLYNDSDLKRYEQPFSAAEHDTIEVSAWKTVEGRREKICKMTDCVWFGNSQLFVCGNPEEKNLVYWSDVQEPLYFPENNYVYVGDHSQTVTAMRQQGELLAIFQEHCLYGMTYSIADRDMYEYALKVGLDATAASTQFAMMPIHASIGCDCPGSIRLVNNRLVWINSDGKGYMLPSVNQYNERNVREISRNIFGLLSKHAQSALRSSFSGEFHGYYVLLVENSMYLLDAQTSAFSSFNYYSKEESAQKALPWFRWTLPTETCVYLMANDTVMYIVASEGDESVVYAMDAATDDGKPIACSLTTKMFDFGRPECKKAVMQMYIGIGDSPESSVSMSYITDQETYGDAWTLESFGDHTEGDPGFMRVHRLTPNVNRAHVFGFRMDCVGAVSIGSIVVKFKEQGVVR